MSLNSPFGPTPPKIDRREDRVPVKLPVWVWGTDPTGKLFVEQAFTVDITPNGGRLKGLRSPVSVGAILGIQNQTNRARFEVTWIGHPGSEEEDHIGLKLVEPGRNERKPILYIDFRDQELAAFKTVLEAHGYSPVLAASTEAGLQFARTMAPAAIILFWPMPDHHEQEAIVMLKAAKPTIPVILLADTEDQVPKKVLEMSDAVILRGDPTRKLMSFLERFAGAGIKPKWPITRTTQRFAINMPVRLSVLRCGQRTEFSGQATDISEGGMNIVMDADLQPGEIVTLWLPLPFTRGETRLDASVRRQDPVGFGFEFVNLENLRREEIRSLCKILPPMDLPQELAAQRAHASAG